MKMKPVIGILCSALAVLVVSSACIAGATDAPLPADTAGTGEEAIGETVGSMGPGETDRYPKTRKLPEELLVMPLPGTQEKQKIEITIIPVATDIFENDYVRMPVRIKFGIERNVELFLRLGAFLDNPAIGEERTGLSDVTVGTKYRWKKRLEPFMSAATVVSVKVPTGGSEDISGEFTHLIPQMVFSKTIEGWSGLLLASTLGLDIVLDESSSAPDGSGSATDNTGHVSFGIVYPMGAFALSLENIYITNRITGGDADIFYVTPEVFWEPSKRRYIGDWEFGLGLRFGLDDAEEDFLVLTRIKWDFPLKIDIKKSWGGEG